ncbi:MAG: T9SS type A sorting domain-containing protein [Saprospiraceae bacterium]
MKRIYNICLFFIAMVISFQAIAQTPRMLFVEEATQASCPPCAAQNPALQATINANLDKVVFIGYQVWWPGFDPMYLDNPGEVQTRIGDYYGDITGAPNIKMQGTSASSAPSALTQTVIDATYAEASEFAINLTADIVDGKLVIAGTIDSELDATGDFRLRLMAIEHEITKADAPGGSTSEEVYHNVFKKFIPNHDGIAIGSSFTAGDSYTVSEEYDLSFNNIYNYDQIELVAIIQNDDTKFVNQAARIGKSDVAVVSNHDNNPGAINVGEQGEVCIGEQTTIAPTVTIINKGADELTSLDITYNVNGGADQTFMWTGNLANLTKTEVTLDDYTFTSAANNTINASVSNPNGGVDGDLTDTDTDGSFISSDVTSLHVLTLNIFTDCYPEETSWEFRDGSGAVVASGGPYTGQAGATITEEVTLATDCYSFNLFDTYGDGMYGSQWNGCELDGSFEIKDQMDNVVYDYDSSVDNAGFFTSNQVFSAEVFVDVDEVALEGKVKMSPNPTTGDLNITLDQVLAGDTDFQIFSLNGKVLMTGQLQNTVNTLNLSSFSNGIYLVRLVNDDKAITERITVQH